MPDVASEHQVDGAGEVVAVFKEKWPLLGEEHRETLVDGDLRLVRFDLAEIRVDCGGQHKAVMQDELRIQPHFWLQGTACEDGMRGVAIIDVAKPAQQSIGNELNIASRRNVIDTAGGRSLIESPLYAIRDAWPEEVFVGARNTAIENDPPLLRVRLRKAQALERDRHEQHVTLAGEASFGVPHGVERLIKTAVIGRKSVAD